MFLYSRADLRKFQALQDLCHNMKDNLEAIKSFKKVTGNICEAQNLKTTAQETLIPERKAVYMSILDVAINGPFHVDTQDIIDILGV